MEKPYKASSQVDASDYSYSVLYSFCSAPNCTDGAAPQAGLIQDAAGNLFGTTTAGGGNSNPACGSNGCGTVFKLDDAGHETVLYSFCSAPNCTDGAAPQAGLIQDAAGNLYGTTVVGGANANSNCSNGCGTVFKVDNTGHETVLYSFCSITVDGSPCLDGSGPQAGLIQDAAGNFYGTTKFGGTAGGGTVFKLDNAGHETIIDGFCEIKPNCPDGSAPEAGLIQDAAGNLYGTTSSGGMGFFTVSGGTVFKLGVVSTVLYNFCIANGCPDGSVPAAGLIQDAAGNLYGTTSHGGAGGDGFRRRRHGVQVGHRSSPYSHIQLLLGCELHRRAASRGWADPGCGGQPVQHNNSGRREFESLLWFEWLRHGVQVGQRGP